MSQSPQSTTRAVEFLGELDGAIARAIHDEEIGDAAVAERGDDLLADGACAENERGVPGEFAEDALGEFYAGGGDGHGARAEFGFGADALADFERALEQTIEDGAGGALFVGEAIGFADLAEDFGFAEEHGVEPGGDAEKMADGVAIVVMIERAGENVGADGVKFAEERGEPGEAVVRRFGRNAVDFAAIAGGEDQRFFEDAAGAEFVSGAARLFGGERHPFAHLNGRCAMVQADEDDFHSLLARSSVSRLPLPTKNTGDCATRYRFTTVKLSTTITKLKMQRREARAPRQAVVRESCR